MTSEMLSIFKNSSIAATIGVIDLFARTRQLNDYTARAYESFVAVIACYFLINVVVMLAMQMLEKRVRIPGTMGR
jgi:glutamate/aspartate transport system permease protein